MSLKYGKTEVEAMVAAIDQDHESAEDAAKAALATAEEIFEKRAKFVVVGQLSATKERIEVPPSDPEAIRLSLGWYSTEGDARKSAESLWHSTATGETFRCWVLPVFHGTPADLHGKRKDQLIAAQAKAKEARGERLRAEMAKQMAEHEERLAGGKGSCQCGHLQAEHRFDGSARGGCGLTECECPKWNEKTK